MNSRYLAVFVLFFSCVSICLHQDTKEESYTRDGSVYYVVRKHHLNTPISPYKIYFSVTTDYGDYVCVMIQMNERFVYDGDTVSNFKTETQLLPTFYYWELRNPDGTCSHRWMAYFMRNRNNTYHTVVELPMEDFKRSWLVMYFRTLDLGHKINQDIPITEYDPKSERVDLYVALDMTEYNWDDIHVIQAKDCK